MGSRCGKRERQPGVEEREKVYFEETGITKEWDPNTGYFHMGTGKEKHPMHNLQLQFCIRPV